MRITRADIEALLEKPQKRMGELPPLDDEIPEGFKVPVVGVKKPSCSKQEETKN